MSDLPYQFTVEYGARPWTTNAERRGNRFERAALTKEWRAAFYLLAKQKQIPAMRRVAITAEPWQAKGVLADTAACNPAVKAAIDGLVDAGVIPDDTSEHIARITFLPTRKGRDALVITIDEILRDPLDILKEHRDNANRPV